MLRVDVSLDLGFHVVTGVGRSARRFKTSTVFHHAYALPRTKFFSSGCCSPTLSCHRQLNLNPKFLAHFHRENGSFEVLSLQTLQTIIAQNELRPAG